MVHVATFLYSLFFSFFFNKVPSQETAGVLTVKALDEIIFHDDIKLVLKLLYASGIKLSQILDFFNNTVLHTAANAGRFKLVKTLLMYVNSTDDDPSLRNVFQQTPKQLAEVNGYTDIANLFNGKVDDDVKSTLKGYDTGPVTKLEELNWEKYLASGWNIKGMNPLTESNRSYPLCSNVLPIVDRLSEEIISHHVPVLIYSQETEQWNAWKNWRKKDIVDRSANGSSCCGSI